MKWKLVFVLYSLVIDRLLLFGVVFVGWLCVGVVVVVELGDPVERFVLGVVVGVGVGVIGRELVLLWCGLVVGGGVVVCVCLWGFVVWVVGGGVLARVRLLVDIIVLVVFVCMLLLGHESRGGGSEVEAWVSANCQIVLGGGGLLCSGEITIVTRGEGILHLAPLVQALAVPDVLLMLVWMGGVLVVE